MYGKCSCEHRKELLDVIWKITYFRNFNEVFKKTPATKFVVFLFIYFFSNDKFTFKKLHHGFSPWNFADFSCFSSLFNNFVSYFVRLVKHLTIADIFQVLLSRFSGILESVILKS